MVQLKLRVLLSDMQTVIAIFKLGIRVANEAIEALFSDEIEMHTCTCYVRLLELIEKAKATDLIPYEQLKEQLRKSVNKLIVKDKSKWSAYICKPSQFIMSSDSAYYADNKEIADYECEFIVNTQLEDGSWDVPWKWDGFPDEWAISKNWWKSTIIILNLLYLKGIGIVL